MSIRQQLHQLEARVRHLRAWIINNNQYTRDEASHRELNNALAEIKRLEDELILTD